MKTFLPAFFVIFWCFESKAVRIDLGAKQLCVQTFNTYGASYADNLEERHQQTLKFLREYDCDIILLQEVIRKDHYQNLVRLSRDINMQSIYFEKPYNDHRRSGLVGLFRGGVQDSDMVYFPPAVHSGLGFLSDFFKTIDKGFGVAQIRFSSVYQNSFFVFNFHLNHISKVERVSQLLMYLKWILENSYSNQAIIAGGDFNFEPDGLEFRIIKHLFQFKDPYEQMRKKPECTHLCEDGGYTVFNFLVGEGTRDYIFFRSSPQMNLNIQDVFVLPKNYNNIFLSDHFGLRAIFQLEDSLKNPSENPRSSEEILDQRVRSFRQVLDEVESFFQDENSTNSTMNFIQSLNKDLKDSESAVIQYLRY